MNALRTYSVDAIQGNDGTGSKKCALNERIAPVLDIVTDTIYSYVET